MNIEYYRNFVAIVEYGTLSSASRALHIAQPSLSNQVKQLEEEYGVALFVRNSRQMVPTDAGRFLYDKAKSIILLEDTAREELKSYSSGLAGILRIGMTQAYPDAAMTELLLKFHQKYPDIRYSFYEMNPNGIMELLRSGVVEIGVVRMLGALPPDLTAVLNSDQHLSVYCRYNNPWISPYDTEVSLSSLNNVPIAISRGFEPTLNEIFQRADVKPIIMSVSTSRNNLMEWAKAGEAIGIICVGKNDSGDNAEIFCRPLVSDDESIAKQLEAKRSFITLKSRQIGTLGQLFIDFSRGYLTENS